MQWEETHSARKSRNPLFWKSLVLCVVCGEALDSGAKTVVSTTEEETPSTEQAKSVVIQLLCQKVRGHTKNAVEISQISTASSYVRRKQETESAAGTEPTLKISVLTLPGVFFCFVFVAVLTLMFAMAGKCIQ